VKVARQRLFTIAVARQRRLDVPATCVVEPDRRHVDERTRGLPLLISRADDTSFIEDERRLTRRRDVAERVRRTPLLLLLLPSTVSVTSS
jgi:hypothetical protein